MNLISDKQDNISMVRVNEELLDWDEDVSLLNGKPFTGVGYMNNNNGQLISEINYENGFPEGLCRKWYANGQLRTEWFAVRGCANWVMEWHESGEILSIGTYKNGVEIEYIEWGTDGEQLIKRVLESGSTMHTYLNKIKEYSHLNTSGCKKNSAKQ